jgi:dTDP-glucose 4,6-dehydratase
LVKLYERSYAVRLLVTGGAGFIGSNYVRRVLDGTLQGIDSMIVLDNLTYAGNRLNLPKSGFEFIHGDIGDQTLVEGLAKRCDAVINFAAESHVDRSIQGSKIFFQTNVIGLQTLLEVARKSAIQKFVQVSTDEVYGSIAEGSWPETDPLNPNSPYAASKAAGDLISRSYFKTYDFDVRITRSSNNYGPYQFPEKIIPLFVTNLLDNLRIPIYGKGLNVRDWLHVDDNCDGIHKVLMAGSPGEIYNIGGGTEMNNLQLTRKILSLMDKDETSIEFVTDRAGHDSRYSVDCLKISNQLRYEPSVQFESGLAETIDWYRANQNWWRILKSR